MNFSNLKEWTTPKGNVTELAIDGVTVWKKVQNVSIGTLAVGSSVFMNVDGVRTEFLVVQQGLPASWVDEYGDTHSYDTSCDGTWLLMKDIYEDRPFDSTDFYYQDSDIHSYLNNTFINLFDSDIQSTIMEIKVPYVNLSNRVTSGDNGLSTKIFLLSCYEVGFVMAGTAKMYADGACLDYFSTGDKYEKRKAYRNGTIWSWYLRSRTTTWERVYIVNSAGSFYGTKHTDYSGIRPALILPSDALVDDHFNVIA